MIFKAHLYHEGDEQEIVDLLSLIFHDWPHFDLNCSSLEHWIWKYVDNSTKISKVVVAKENGKIVGCHHSGYVNIKSVINFFSVFKPWNLEPIQTIGGRESIEQ